ncbi:hypothetical protein E4U09_007543 [Claviceps aff. purpurea]|uniref:Uncharacterized protein n=1 Tax=Claviceps aff. purpurea TaxID=1967640 RepID=A0A9P7QBJ5_9HYPO|nr:hypothetical protein E4U09_007543 [Claviceps aff. purpurea]
MSSNPFRKKTPATLDTSRTSSKSSMRCDDPGASGDSKDNKNNKENKPVRRVRVLSPPPLSPDASVWSLDGAQPPGSHSDDTLRFSDLDPASDPFGGTSSTDESDRDRDGTMTQSYHLVQEKAAVVTTPANPFSNPSSHVQGPGDLQTERREEGEVLKAAAAGKKALNVDAFRSLLMTGRVGDEQHHEPTAKQTLSTVQPVSPLNATANIANNLDDDSSVSSTSESQVEQGEEQAVSSLTSPQDPPKERKLALRPPPPSSRHGKSLKQHEPDPGTRLDEENASQGAVSARPQAVSPLRGSLDDDIQPFVTYRELDTVSTEAEVNEASQPQADSTARRQNTTKKPAPAPPPPPRRGHSRSDTKVPPPAHSPSCAHRPSSAAAGDPASRPETTKPSGPVPTPPPSRRPHTASRQTSQLSASAPGVSSPTSARGDHAEPASSSHWPDLSAENHHSSKSSAAPPPPPARQSSTRRPSSLHSTTEGQPRRVSSASESRLRDGPGVLVPPPLPPPRNRSGSGHGAKRASEVASPVEGPGLGTGTGTGTGKENGKGADILADLDALQREVDALRGTMN